MNKADIKACPLPLTPGDDVYLLYGVDGTPLAFRVREKLKEKLLAKEGAQ